MLITARTLTSQAQRYGNPGVGEFDQVLFENRLIAIAIATEIEIEIERTELEMGGRKRPAAVDKNFQLR